MALNEEALRANWQAVRGRIERACLKAGRAPDEVRLLAVSKFHSLDAIRALHALGQRDFAENYAQDLAEKAAALRDLDKLTWHFIGGFQKNKAKLLVPTGAVIETVAAESHARAIETRATDLGRTVRVFIQVNCAGETQKSGVAPEQLGALVEVVRACASLSLDGLMVIPPADDEVKARASYRMLRELAREQGVRELSMGMSDDLEVAIEEGSTIVRVGTAIFGERPRDP